MKVAYSSAISAAFAVTDSVSSHVVVFTACQFGVLFVALITLSIFLLKAYNKRRSRVSHANKSKCLQAIEYPTKPKVQRRKNIQENVKEVRPKLSKKAKKRLRAAANGKKTPLPVTSMTQQPDRDDILKAIEGVSSLHVFVESKEKKAKPAKKVRKLREVGVRNVAAPVFPVVASTQPVAVKTAASSKAAVATQNASQNVQTKKSRRPQRRVFTLSDYILRRDMHLDTYVQTYRV